MKTGGRPLEVRNVTEYLSQLRGKKQVNGSSVYFYGASVSSARQFLFNCLVTFEIFERHFFGVLKDVLFYSCWILTLSLAFDFLTYQEPCRWETQKDCQQSKNNRKIKENNEEENQGQTGIKTTRKDTGSGTNKYSPCLWTTFAQKHGLCPV